MESTHGTPAAKRLARAKRGLAETPSRSRLERQTAEESTPAPTVVEVRSVEPQNLPFSITPPAAGGQHAVRSVTYDYESGRKRTIMADGSVFDEPFDPKAFLNAEVPPDAPT